MDKKSLDEQFAIRSIEIRFDYIRSQKGHMISLSLFE